MKLKLILAILCLFLSSTLWAADVDGPALCMSDPPSVCGKTESVQLARTAQGVAGVGVSAASNCTGALIFEWHAESTTITSGTPPGCNTNAATTVTLVDATLSSAVAPSDGTYALLRSGNLTQYATVATDVSKTSGTLTFDLYITTWSDWKGIVFFSVDGTNDIRILMTSSSGILRGQYVGDNTTVSVDDVSPYITFDTWTPIVFKWRTGATNPSISLKVGTNTASTSDTDLTAIIGTPSVMTMGHNGDTVQTFRIDNIKLYNTWQ